MSNAPCGVDSSSTQPSTVPSAEITLSVVSRRRSPYNWSRNPATPPTYPGQSATEFVTLAASVP